MLELRTSTSEEQVEVLPLFSIDGTVYSVPTNPSPAMGLKYMKLLRTQGSMIADGWALEEMLGTEAYDALSEFKGLTVEDLEQLKEIVGKHMLGSLEEPEKVAVGKASLRRASTRSAGRSTTSRTSKRTS